MAIKKPLIQRDGVVAELGPDDILSGVVTVTNTEDGAKLFIFRAVTGEILQFRALPDNSVQIEIG